MTIEKRVFSSKVAAAAILYAHEDENSQIASPLVKASFNPGFEIPKYDELALEYTGNDLTLVTYKLSDVTVAVVVLTYTSSVLTNVKRTT